METEIEITEADTEAEIDPLTGVETPAEAATKVDGEIEASQETPPEVDPLINQEKVQEKINKAISEKGVSDRKVQILERELRELKGKQATAPSEAPTLEQFNWNDDEYNSALMDYKIAETLKDQTRLNTQQAVENKRADVAKAFFTKEAEFIATHPEYQEAVNNLPQFQPETLDAIYELGPEMSNYLAQHLDVADAIANVSPITAGVKLGQIAMKLSVKKPEVKPSNAPDPVTTLNGAAGLNKSQENMSMSEIMAL